MGIIYFSLELEKDPKDPVLNQNKIITYYIGN